jgi:Mrp family chromosome partitioning ATPase
MAKMFGVEGEKLEVKEGKIQPLITEHGLKLISLACILTSPDDAVIWRGPLKMKTIKQFVEDVDWGKLDFLIIDSPPGTGDEPLSIIQLIPGIDGVVIVTTPQDIALLDSRKAVSFAKELKVPVLGIVENMSGLSCPHCGKNIDLFSSGGGEKAAKELKVPFLGKISLDPHIVESGDKGNPFISSDKGSKTKEEIMGIVSKVIGSLMHAYFKSIPCSVNRPMDPAKMEINNET